MREQVYGLLRRVFSHEVDEPFLAWFRNQCAEEPWPDLGLSIDELGSSDTAATLEGLAVDFCRLFITSGAAGTPHESAQAEVTESPMGRVPLLWGDAAVATRRLYREAEFEMDTKANRIPDALTVQFEFMERLAAAEAIAEASGRAAEVQRLRGLQRRMLGEHLVRWVPDYGRKLRGLAESGFYRSFLDLAAQFVEWDSRELGVAPQPVAEVAPSAIDDGQRAVQR